MSKTRTPEEYRATRDEFLQDTVTRTNAAHAEHYGVSATTIKKWKRGDFVKDGERKPRGKNLISASDESYEMAFAEISEIIDITETEVRRIYKEAMIKIIKILDARNQKLIELGLNPWSDSMTANNEESLRDFGSNIMSNRYSSMMN